MQPMIPPYGPRFGGAPPTPFNQPNPGMGLGQVFNRLRGAGPGAGSMPAGLDEMAVPGADEAIPGQNVPIPELTGRMAAPSMPPGLPQLEFADDASGYGQQVLDTQDDAAMYGMPGPMDQSPMSSPASRPMSNEDIMHLQNQVQDDLGKEIAGRMSPQDRVFATSAAEGLGRFRKAGQPRGMAPPMRAPMPPMPPRGLAGPMQ